MKNLTLPNKLTIARIIAVPVFVLGILADNSWLAGTIFIFCFVSDFLDGFIARRRGQRTQLGAFLDPLADKFLLISAFVTFAAMDKIPVWIPIVVITKNFITSGGWLLRYIITKNTVVSPTLFGKASTVVEMAVILFIIFKMPDRFLFIFTYLMLILITVSTLNYIFTGVKEIEKR